MTNPYFQFQAQALQGQCSNNTGQGQAGGSLLPLASLLQSMARQTNNANQTDNVGRDVLMRPSVVLSSDPQTVQSQGVTDTVSMPVLAQNDHNCNYRDYSRVPVDQSEAFFASQAQLHDGDEPRGTNFPSKLHDMLSREEFADVIAWSPHGRSWRVLKPKAFELKILPKYFRHGKYNSFMRQVNGWGFRRISQGPDFNSYYHEYFLRGMPHLCRRMRRASVAKGEGDVAYDPDFRTMRPVPMQPESSSRATAENNRVSDSDSSVQSASHAQARRSPIQQTLSNARVEVHSSQQLPGPVVTSTAPFQNNSCHNGNTGMAQNAVLRALTQLQTTVPRLQPTIPATHVQPRMVQQTVFAPNVNSVPPQAVVPDIAALIQVLQQQQVQQQQQVSQFPVRPSQQQGQTLPISRFPAVQQQQPSRNAFTVNAVQGQNANAATPPNQQLLLQAIACLSQQVHRNNNNGH